MYQNCCKKCGSLDLFIETKGSNTGLYCSDCGAWIKWLGKDEINAFNHAKEQEIIFANEKAKEVYDKLKLQRQKTSDANDKIEEFRIACMPVLEFLNKYYDPHSYAIITEGRAEIVSGEIGIPLHVRD